MCVKLGQIGYLVISYARQSSNLSKKVSSEAPAAIFIKHLLRLRENFLH